MRTHVKDRDPLFYYEVLNVVGVGSMGSVATVRKRDKVMGGSARKDIVDTFHRQDKQKECFSMPLLGGLFRFCIEDVGIGKSGSFRSRKSSSSDQSTDADVSSHSFRSSKRNLFTESERSSTSGKYQETYAMKSIHLNRITDQVFVEELKNEIEILKQLDHPHIVRPIETFDRRNHLFIVMELCSGGDLYSRDPYTEEEAARIISSILSAVSYMHNRGIVHRDLKYENILFVNRSPKAEVKLIDFGLSKTYGKSGQTMTDGVGTIYTMAPEVLRGKYTSQADLWSVGVIAYMLLSSQMPFYGSKRRHIVEQIMQCRYDFNGRRWERISPQAKAFVGDLLVDNPDERATAEEAAASMWLNKRYGATVRAPTEEELDTTVTFLSSYSHYAKLKKLVRVGRATNIRVAAVEPTYTQLRCFFVSVQALMVIAHKSTSEEIGILRKVFEKYDTEKKGVISLDEFKAALEIYGYSDEELVSMFEGVVSEKISLKNVWVAFTDTHVSNVIFLGCGPNG
jgi:serine/threonine protein kinase